MYTYRGCLIAAQNWVIIVLFFIEVQNTVHRSCHCLYEHLRYQILRIYSNQVRTYNLESVLLFTSFLTENLWHIGCFALEMM